MLGRSPGEGKGYPLQYSGQPNKRPQINIHRHLYAFIQVNKAFLNQTRKKGTVKEAVDIFDDIRSLGF